jgi:hypothetical protein
MDKKAILLVWLILCHLGNIADVGLTLYAIHNGASELNPFMAWTLSISPLLFAVTKFILFGLAIDFLAQHSPIFLRWVAIIYMSIMAWHLNLLFGL